MQTFGPVAYIAIGATMVGSIVWTAKVGQTVAKGEELGYFAFGGSTVITIFQADRLCWDEDLVQNRCVPGLGWAGLGCTGCSHGFVC